MIRVKIKTKAITRLLKFIPIFFFYVNGGSFKVTLYIKNFSSQQFQGGIIRILVTYAFGNLYENITERLGVIDLDNKEVRIDVPGKWGVLAHGYALFYVNLQDSSQNIVPLCDDNRRPLQIQQIGQNGAQWYHIHTFHALTPGELYTLLALSVSSLALILNFTLQIILNLDKIHAILGW